MAETSIEWTHRPGTKPESWNPVKGCTKISPGCARCYASTFVAEVLVPQVAHAVDEDGARVAPRHRQLEVLGRLAGIEAALVHVALDAAEPFGEYIAAVFAVMALTPRHTYIVLTKRHERMLEWFAWAAAEWPKLYPFAAILAALRAAPAAIKLVSFEPLLEDVADVVDLTGIDWAIVGGESGSGARPFDPAWARRLVEKARSVGAAPFIKQLGARPLENLAPTGNFRTHEGKRQMEFRGDLVRITSRKGNNIADFPPDLRVREWPIDTRPLNLTVVTS
jgi:protein gp37